MIDPEGLNGKKGGGGVLPRNFGKDKPMNPMPTADEMKKEAERKQGQGQDFADSVKCYFGLKNCDAEDAYKLGKATICLVARCTSTCPPSTFTIDYKNGPAVAFDPETTTCQCILVGLNPNYQGGAPPGLTAPGR